MGRRIFGKFAPPLVIGCAVALVVAAMLLASIIEEETNRPVDNAADANVSSSELDRIFQPEDNPDQSRSRLKGQRVGENLRVLDEFQTTASNGLESNEGDSWTQADADRRSWFQELGYFSEYERIAYASYTNDDLVELGSNGDLLALDVLHRRQADQGDFKSAIETLKLAAANGSIAAVERISLFYEAELLALDDRADLAAQRARDLAIEAASWYEASIILGNLHSLYKGASMLDRAGIRFSDRDIALVSERANGHIQEINAARVRLGRSELSPRRMPEHLQRMAEQTLDYVLESNSSGWGTQYYTRRENNP